MKHILSILVIVLFCFVYPWKVLKTDDYHRIKKIKTHSFNSDSVIIGDSRLRNMGVPGHQNLCIAGIGLPEVYYIANSVIEHRKSVKKIIFCIDPDHLYVYNHFETLQRDRFYSDNFLDEIQSNAIKYNDSLYILQHRPFLENIRFHLLLGEFVSRIQNPAYIFKDFHEYYMSKGDYQCHSTKNKSAIKPDNTKWNDVKPSPVNAMYGQKLFALLSSHPEIAVTWVIPQRCGKYNPAFAPVFVKWLTAMGAGNNIKWVNMGDYVDDDDFFDQKHLRCAGNDKIVPQLMK